MIEVTFLGVGAALPAPGQTNSAFLVTTPQLCLLFDCGPAILQQLALVGRTPADLTHVYISHGHGDHALGLPMLLLARALHRTRELTLVASTVTHGHLRRLWQHAYADIPDPVVRNVDLPADVPGEAQLATDVRLRTWPMIHSTLFPVLGARFEIGTCVLAFTADTARCDNVVSLARDADLLVHDSRHAVTVEPLLPIQANFHCSARDAGQYASAAKALALALVHIGPEYEGRHELLVAEAQASFAGHVFAPRPGAVYRP